MKFVTVLFVFIGLSFAKELPSFITKCKRENPVERNRCILQRTEELKPYLIKGIPEMKLPSIEPLHVPKLEIHTGNGNSIEFNAVLTDIVVYGGKNLQVKEVNFDLENLHIFLHIYIPELIVKGTYALNGKILLLELNSQGLSDVNISDLESTTHMNISIVTKNNKHYVDLGNDYKVNRKYGKFKVHFDNLFKDNQQLTEETNKAINDNVEELGKEIGPLLDNSVHLLITGIVKPFFDEFSLEELFN